MGYDTSWFRTKKVKDSERQIVRSVLVRSLSGKANRQNRKKYEKISRRGYVSSALIIFIYIYGVVSE